MKHRRAAPTLSFAVVGSGGAGVITAGALLLDAAARAGLYGLMTRSHGPQIRGGEAASFVRLGAGPVDAVADRIDAVVALGWKNAEQFAAELRIGDGTLVLTDARAGDVPGFVAEAGANVVPVDLSALAREVKGQPNVVAAGLCAAFAGLDTESLIDAVRPRFAAKGEAVVEASVAGALRGHALASEIDSRPLPLSIERSNAERWQATGNQLTGLGALHGGIRFAAGYPITPATDLLEWLAEELPALGGQLLQSEDELAAIHAVLGAAWAGTPSMTATSGPGLALMVEAIGYGVSAEIPALIVDVQRGGPSTGIPTKTEQADLNLAIYGLSGDAPHLVIAPTSVGDCLPTTEWAARLAERLQVPAILLSDQLLGQARAILDRPPRAPEVPARAVAVPGGDTPYRRYAATDDGVAPRSLPGAPGLGYTATGLEKRETGAPSAQPEVHAAQLRRREHKLMSFDYGERWADLEGAGELALVCWGSTAGPAREALERLRADGGDARLIALRLLAPAQPERMAAALEGVERLVVVDQTYGAQLLGTLRASYALPAVVVSHARPGPVPFTAGELHEVLREVARADAEAWESVA